VNQRQRTRCPKPQTAWDHEIRARQRDDDLAAVHFDVEVAVIRHQSILAQKQRVSAPGHLGTTLMVRMRWSSLASIARKTCSAPG
jgi:hypothetical protein